MLLNRLDQLKKLLYKLRICLNSTSDISQLIFSHSTHIEVLIQHESWLCSLKKVFFFIFEIDLIFRFSSWSPDLSSFLGLLQGHEHHQRLHLQAHQDGERRGR